MVNFVSGLPDGLARRAAQRTLVMGVLNVTPDSFSDGGRFLDPDRAVEHGLLMWAQGADIVDVGGESTRPGAARIGVAEEIDRVETVVRDLAQVGVVVSIDTMHPAVAEVALAAGALLVNDVSGGLAEPEMLDFIATVDVPYIVMHWRGHSIEMDQLARYDNVVADVVSELHERLRACDKAGISLDRIVIDPGLGFAKNAEHNWALLSHLDALTELGRPILVGASRKRFLGELLVDDNNEPRPLDGRDDATSAISALVARAGAWCVRVHDVRGSIDAVRVARAWSTASDAPPEGSRRG